MHGTSFYDFNSNALNALTYGQTLNGVSRDDPNADTHDHRYGVSLGGPMVRIAHSSSGTTKAAG